MRIKNIEKKKLNLYLIGLTILLLIAAIYFYLDRSSYHSASKKIEIEIPKDAKVIESYDTHGGLHGDGTYFIAFQLNDAQYKKVAEQTTKSKLWHNGPLPDELNKRIFSLDKNIESSVQVKEGIAKYFPNSTKNATYYFKNEFIEGARNENYEDIISKSRNFIFSILDTTNKRLYILVYDS